MFLFAVLIYIKEAITRHLVLASRRSVVSVATLSASITSMQQLCIVRTSLLHSFLHSLPIPTLAYNTY